MVTAGISFALKAAGLSRPYLPDCQGSTQVRADLIRQMYERPDTRELAEVLIDLEAEPLLRLDVMDALKESVRVQGRRW